jgi:hypothetical protein
MEEIDRDRVHVELVQRNGDVDELLVRLAHAGDEPRTRRDPRPLDGLQRRYPITVCVRCRDRTVMGGARVQIVVVTVYPSVSELLRLLLGEEPEAGAELHRHLSLDPPYG